MSDNLRILRQLVLVVKAQTHLEETIKDFFVEIQSEDVVDIVDESLTTTVGESAKSYESYVSMSADQLLKLVEVVRYALPLNSPNDKLLEDLLSDIDIDFD